MNNQKEANFSFCSFISNFSNIFFVRLFVIILFLTILHKSIYAKEIVYSGNAIQSGMIKLEIPERVKQLILDDKELNFSQNIAYIGFSRSDTLVHHLQFVFNDGSIKEEILQLEERSYDIQKIENIPKKYVEKPKDEELINRVNLEYQIITDVRKNIIYPNKNLYFIDIEQPLVSRISSVFGSQRIINGIPKRPHFGIDYAAKIGTPIKNCADGIVVLTGDFFYNGKFILIDHGVGLSSIYIHLD